MGRLRLILAAAAVAAIIAVSWRPGRSATPRVPSTVEPSAPHDQPPVGEEPDTGDLMVQVVAEDGRPLEGATVRSEGPPPRLAVVDVVTDASGCARIRNVEPPRSLRARKPGYLVAWPAELDDRVARFVLVAAAPVDGRVVFPDGQPVANCVVRARNADSLFEEDLDSVVTDADGRFQIAGVPLCHPFLAEASITGYAPVTVRRLPVEAPIAIVLTLGEGGVIEGSVTDGDGNARAGARVVVVEDGSPSPLRTKGRHALATVNTDERGRYRIRGVAASAAHIVYAEDWPLVARIGPLTVAPGEVAHADLKLQPPGGLRVRLVDAEGRRRSRWGAIEIVLRDPERRGLLGRRGTYLSPAEADDTYEIAGLLPLEYELWVSPPGGRNSAPRVVLVEPGRTVEVEWVTEAGRVLTGRVVGEGGPLPATTVVGLSWRIPRPNGHPGYGTVYPDGIGEDGRFELDVASGVEIELRVTASGFLPWERRIGAGESDIEVVLHRAPHVRFRLESTGRIQIRGDLFEPDANGDFLVPLSAAGSPVDLAFDLNGSYVLDKLVLDPGETRDLGLIRPAPNGALAGKVVNPAGRPVPGALVETVELWSGMHKARTDRAGAFRFEDQPLVRTTLRVRADGFPDLWTVVDPHGYVNVELVAGGEVRGSVLDSRGEPVPGAKVPFRALGGDEERAWEAEADSLGRFRILLPPGRFEASPYVDGFGERASGPVVEIHAGETSETEIRLPWSLRLWH